MKTRLEPDRPLRYAFTQEQEHALVDALGQEVAASVLPQLRALVRASRRRNSIASGTTSESIKRSASWRTLFESICVFVDAVDRLDAADKRAFLAAVRVEDGAVGGDLDAWLLALRRFSVLQQTVTRRRRGRPPNLTRRARLMQAFKILHDAGIRITKGRGGTAAVVARIVLEATHEHVIDFFPDLALAAAHFTSVPRNSDAQR